MLISELNFRLDRRQAWRKPAVGVHPAGENGARAERKRAEMLTRLKDEVLKSTGFAENND